MLHQYQANCTNYIVFNVFFNYNFRLKINILRLICLTYRYFALKKLYKYIVRIVRIEFIYLNFFNLITKNLINFIL